MATVYEYQHYVKSPEDAVADVLKAGLYKIIYIYIFKLTFIEHVMLSKTIYIYLSTGVDINCGTYLLLNTQSAIKQGKVQEEDIDRALVNLFLVQLRLGLFNGDPAKGKFGKLGPKDVCTSGHKKLALEAARQGIVLLKNDRKFLPLDKDDVSSLAIIGPMANDSSNLGGGYSGLVSCL